MQDWTDELLETRDGCGDEYIGVQEDRIARCITASEQLNLLRSALHLLHKRNKIDTMLYRDACDILTFVDGVVLDGKQAIVSLRNVRRKI